MAHSRQTFQEKLHQLQSVLRGRMVAHRYLPADPNVVIVIL